MSVAVSHAGGNKDKRKRYIKILKIYKRGHKPAWLANIPLTKRSLQTL